MTIAFMSLVVSSFFLVAVIPVLAMFAVLNGKRRNKFAVLIA